jgi:hypothetical protein
MYVSFVRNNIFFSIFDFFFSSQSEVDFGITLVCNTCFNIQQLCSLPKILSSQKLQQFKKLQSRKVYSKSEHTTKLN